VLEPETPGGYSYVGVPSYGTPGPSLRSIEPSALGGKLAGMTGSHRADGLFALCGEGIVAGRFEGAHIMDLAPTILTLCEVAVPQGWDGHTLPVAGAGVVGEAEAMWSQRDERDYDAAQTAVLQRRLEQLGYLA
jgi:hypothetical protein